MKKRRSGLTYNITKPNKGWFKDDGKKQAGACLICGGGFEYYPSVRIKIYCSQNCYHESRKGMKRPAHSEFMKKAHRDGDVSSDGFKGKTHSNHENKMISERMKDRWKDNDDYFNSDEYRQILSDKAVEMRNDGKFNHSGHPRSSGWFKINGLTYYFRSSWEVLYARYLEFLLGSENIKKWEYEPKTFWFDNIKRGVRSYLPDFRITNNDGSIEYHEVKGWMTDKSKTKIKRMAKYYPNIVLVVFQEKEITGIRKLEKLYPEAVETEKPKK